MRWYATLWTFVAILVATTASPCFAGRRVALVIGNSAYLNVSPLNNSVNDAQAIGQLFNAAGFAVVTAEADLGLAAFRHALADFEIEARGADVAIVFYSGHGLELNGQNYLVPVDASLKRDVDVKDETVPLDRVLDAVAGATVLKLIILDACRNDPFKIASRTRSVSRGLARIEPADGNELVAYAAKAGTVASDGDDGHSPYTTALLKRLTTPGLDIELALRRVRDDVVLATQSQQIPFYYGSIGGGEIALVPDLPSSPTPTPVQPPAVTNDQQKAAPPSTEVASLEVSTAVHADDPSNAALCDLLVDSHATAHEIMKSNPEHAFNACSTDASRRPSDDHYGSLYDVALDQLDYFSAMSDGSVAAAKLYLSSHQKGLYVKEIDVHLKVLGVAVADELAPRLMEGSDTKYLSSLPPASLFAAVAKSRGRYFGSSGGTRLGAANNALDQCKKSREGQCKVVANLADEECFSLSASWPGWGVNRQTAEFNAIQECYSHSGAKCATRWTYCTP